MPPAAGKAALRGLLDLVLPRLCAGCRLPHEPAAHDASEIGRVLCAACSSGLEFLDGDACRLCQLPGCGSAPDGFCARCSAEGSSLDACCARIAFEGAAESWVRAFKYPRPGIAGLVPGPESVAVALARDAAATLGCPKPDLVIPVPLHPTRLRGRGFNPATSLARAISKKFGGQLSTDLLLRSRDTPSQTHLGRRQRRDNVRGAFCCSAGAAASIWLVDDVVTTGSTLEAAARCLRRAGAQHIAGICVARTR